MCNFKAMRYFQRNSPRKWVFFRPHLCFFSIFYSQVGGSNTIRSFCVRYYNHLCPKNSIFLRIYLVAVVFSSNALVILPSVIFKMSIGGLPKPGLINVTSPRIFANDSIVTTDNDSDNTPKRNDTRY